MREMGHISKGLALFMSLALGLTVSPSIFAQEGPEEGGEGFETEGEGDLPPEGEGEPEEGEEEQHPVKVTVFIFPELETDQGVATEIMAGLRRGIRADKRLSYVDPSKALASASASDEEEEEHPPADEALDRLMEAIDLAGNGRWRQVVRILDDVLDVFESDLSHTPRQALVDASMLWGAAQCQLRRMRACRSAFRRVVTFRETVEYDEEILPPGPRAVFEEVRDETLEGPRGSVMIESDPPGAEVFVDGRFVGAAPTRAEGLLAGDHYVTLKMAGYQRQVNRVSVQTDFEETVSYELVELDNAPLLREALESARREMGQVRVGTGMRDLWSLLLIDQVVLGEIQRIDDTDQFNLTLYLYDLRTNLGLRRIRRQIDWSEHDLSIAEALAADLYRDVDLSGRIRPVPEERPEAPPPPPPFYRTWWFWSIMGAVIVGTTIGVASSIERNGLPEGVGVLDVPF